MIKNLIFDFGKVLVDYDFDAFFLQHIPDEKRRNAFKPLFYNETMQQRFDREDETLEAIGNEVIAQHPELAEEVRFFINHYEELVIGEIEGMRELITRLKSEGFRIYGLSNWCSKVYATMAQYEIFKLLDGYVVSSEEKSIKPEKKIYLRLFEKYDLKPEECLFADDKMVNIDASRQVGMDGIVFENTTQYERELRQRLKNQ
ncbi:MAG: HAD family phosphatase [Bacteroidales bacterium]|nr:HAD family phosphatase [Bacteroidales bacterium]